MKRSVPNRLLSFISATFFALMSANLPAWALSGTYVEAGHGDNIDIVRIGTLWNLEQRWLAAGGWHMAPHIQSGLGLWVARGDTGETAAELFIIPSVRYRPDTASGQQPYLEAGVGAHLVSDRSVDPERDLGRNLLLGEHLGLGMVFGDRSQFDVGYRFQYLDNAGSKSPNPGLRAHQVRLLYNY